MYLDLGAGYISYFILFTLREKVRMGPSILILGVGYWTNMPNESPTTKTASSKILKVRTP